MKMGYMLICAAVFGWLLLPALCYGAATDNWESALIQISRSTVRESLNIYCQSDNVTNIQGRAFSNPASLDALQLHRMNMVTFAVGNGATGAPITWNVGDFTGFNPPPPLSDFQRGIDNGWYGSTAVQMQGTASGMFINTESSPEHLWHNLTNVQMACTWADYDQVRPWAGAGSEFVMKFLCQVPNSTGVGGAIPYTAAIIYLKDTTTGMYLWYSVPIYDIRGWSTFSNALLWDHVTQQAIVMSYFGSNSAYIKKDLGSNESTGSTWTGWREYGFRVPRANITKAIQDVNLKYNISFSQNPDDYIMTLASWQAEIYWPPGGNGTLAMSVKDAVVGSTGGTSSIKDCYVIEAEDTTNVTQVGSWYTESYAGHSGGIAMVSKNVGATLTLNFRGKSVFVLVSKGPNRGIAGITLDAVPKSDIDLYSAAGQPQFAVLVADGLSPATHTLVVSVTGNKNASSSDTYLVIDAFRIEKPDTAVLEFNLPVIILIAVIFPIVVVKKRQHYNNNSNHL